MFENPFEFSTSNGGVFVNEFGGKMVEVPAVGGQGFRWVLLTRRGTVQYLDKGFWYVDVENEYPLKSENNTVLETTNEGERLELKKYSEDNWVLYHGDSFMELGRYSDEATAVHAFHKVAHRAGFGGYGVYVANGLEV